MAWWHWENDLVALGGLGCWHWAVGLVLPGSFGVGDIGRLGWWH